jgi:hypothetical protein
MRESVSGVPPRSYSGSKSHSMIRARAYGQVTLLAGLGSVELAHNGIRPSPRLSLATPCVTSMLHRTLCLYHDLLGGAT